MRSQVTGPITIAVGLSQKQKWNVTLYFLKVTSVTILSQWKPEWDWDFCTTSGLILQGARAAEHQRAMAAAAAKSGGGSKRFKVKKSSRTDVEVEGEPPSTLTIIVISIGVICTLILLIILIIVSSGHEMLLADLSERLVYPRNLSTISLDLYAKPFRYGTSTARPTALRVSFPVGPSSKAWSRTPPPPTRTRTRRLQRLRSSHRAWGMEWSSGRTKMG